MNPVARCAFCGLDFEVAKELVGGYANCPQCHKATRVEGLRDPIWRLWQVGVLAALLVVSWFVFRGAGPGPAIGVFLGGLVLAWLISRGF